MELSLLKNLVYLAQNPEGRYPLVSNFHLNYGLIGGLLLELSFQEKITVENEYLLVKGDLRDSNPVIDEIFLMIRESKKPRKIKYWINKLSRKSKRLKETVIHRLEKENKILLENKKFLYIFTYKKIHLKDRSNRLTLIQKLRHAILMKSDFDENDAALLGLIEACKMHKIFTKDREELKVIKKELDELIKTNPIAANVDKTIQEVQAAIMTTIIASTAVNAATIGR